VFIDVADLQGVPVRAHVSSNNEREMNEACLLKLEAVILLGQNVKDNELYIGANFSFHTAPNLLRRP
jgi:hypothetical protein